MTSDYNVEEFAQRLLELSELRPLNLRPAGEKMFYGEVDNTSFKLRRNSRYTVSSTILFGEFRPEGEKTAINLSMVPDMFDHYALRVVPLFPLVFVNIVAYQQKPPILVIVGLNAFFIALMVLVIVADNYFTKAFMRKFKTEMKITPH